MTTTRAVLFKRAGGEKKAAVHVGKIGKLRKTFFFYVAPSFPTSKSA